MKNVVFEMDCFPSDHLVSKLRGINEARIIEIENFDFRDVGYSDDEIASNQAFRVLLRNKLSNANDNASDFLTALRNLGIAISEDSDFLSSQQPLHHVFNLPSPSTQDTRINAMFLTNELLQNILINAVGLGKQVRKELEDYKSAKAVIFLSRRPNPKSIFHEGGHALQYIHGMDMSAEDSRLRLKREMEISSALIHLKNAQRLRSVSRGEYRVGKGRFGATATLGSNDIYQEVQAFRSNQEKLIAINAENCRSGIRELLKLSS